MATTLRRALLRLRPETLTLLKPFHDPTVPARSPPRCLLRVLPVGSISRFSSNGIGGGSTELDLSDEESKRRLYNRLLYRSKQRGFLELDLVLGNWVEENIRSMDELRIRALVDVLDLENPELWKWLTGQEQPPEAVNSNPVFSAVRSKVIQNLDKHAAPETRSSPGRPWVRGWDDKRGVDGRPIYEIRATN
ncbi:succinate dehydrogenase assembly factor 2, mitochondrial-like isoform X1 [Ananas comosus]|uniref:Succinate dehydrogenase assembly factor 2, mitochondrial-like isoform X1 n=1 Tax=Ananas comosus TaxID=4615 RepID=A0A6P5GDX6_ANACO|nr:succinate dehydrogenase assembly factor 2, mitochondrial-like isoform X1 [Ananas comosus]